MEARTEGWNTNLVTVVDGASFSPVGPGTARSLRPLGMQLEFFGRYLSDRRR
jgi:hypothetical protein